MRKELIVVNGNSLHEKFIAQVPTYTAPEIKINENGERMKTRDGLSYRLKNGNTYPIDKYHSVWEPQKGRSFLSENLVL